MLLKEYFDKYKVDPVRFALDCGLRPVTIASYLSGKRKPWQKTAEIIERKTNNLVTVKELKGKDARTKYRGFETELEPSGFQAQSN